MKTPLLLLTLLSQTTFASIINSNYEVRMNDTIETAIVNNCNQMLELTLIKTEKRVEEIDQGIIDIYYTSTFTGKQVYDQNIYDVYDITVETSYDNSYDHQAQESGYYHVDSVECKMRM